MTTALLPSTDFSYYVTTVDPSGKESAPTGPINIRTLAGSATPPTAPAPVPEPYSWMSPAFVAPTGNVWTATQNNSPTAAGSASSGTAQFNVGCGLQYAFDNMNPLGGDLIVVTAGLVYPAPNPTGFRPRSLLGATAWTYVISSETPEYKSGGKLPAIHNYTGPYFPEPWSLTAGPGAGATTATLVDTWTRKTGLYPVQFYNATAGTDQHEQRYVLFTQGSKAISWNSTRNPCGLDGTPGPGLVFAVQPVIAVKYLPSPTLYDYDNGALPIIKGGGPGTDGYVVQGLLASQFTHLRFVGISFECRPHATFENWYVIIYNGSDVFWDRCIIGNDSSLYNTGGYPNLSGGTQFGFVHHGAVLAGANQTARQCYIQGIMQPVTNLGTDSNALFSLGGGPYCIEYNYLEACSESIIFGGGFIQETNVPKQCTFRGNFATKPQWWPVATQHLTFGAGGTPAVTYTYTGDGVTTKFTGINNIIWDRSSRYYVTINGVVQAPSTYTMNAGTTAATKWINFATPPANGAAIAVKGAAVYLFGDYVKNHFEVKALRGGQIYGNTFWNSWEAYGGGGNYRGASISVGTRDQQAANDARNFTIYKTCPWLDISDVDVYDNISWRVQCVWYPFSCVDYNPQGWAGRMRLRNNQIWMAGNPVSPQEAIYRHQMFPWTHNGALADIIVANNTVIWDPIGCSNAGSPSSQFSLYFITTNLQDRYSVVNNIVPNNVVSGGTPTNTPLNSAQFTNPGYLGWDRNLTVVDTTGPFPPAPATTYKKIAYNAIGFKNFVDNLTPPKAVSDWDIPLGTTYIGTDGLPIGARFGDRNAMLFLGNSLQGPTFTAITNASAHNQWLVIGGVDSRYGNPLPRGPSSLWGGSITGQTDSIQQIGNVLGPSISGGAVMGGDITEEIITDNSVPTGVSSSVLRSTMVNAYNSTYATQDAYQHQPNGTTPQGMLYMSRWIWLQADLQSRMPSNWMEICETKTPDRDAGDGLGTATERFQLGIVSYTTYGTGTPVFQVLHDAIGSAQAVYMQTWLGPTAVGTGPNAIGSTYKCPIPLGRWFKVEFAMNRADAAGNGWLWIAMTDPGSSDPQLQAGVQVFAMKGAFSFTDRGTVRTIGLNAARSTDKINRVFLHSVYSDMTRSAASPFVMKATDFQLYPGWPWGATAHPSDYL